MFSVHDQTLWNCLWWKREVRSCEIWSWGLEHCGRDGIQWAGGGIAEQIFTFHVTGHSASPWIRINWEKACFSFLITNRTKILCLKGEGGFGWLEAVLSAKGEEQRLHTLSVCWRELDRLLDHHTAGSGYVGNFLLLNLKITENGKCLNRL